MTPHRSVRLRTATLGVTALLFTGTAVAIAPPAVLAAGGSSLSHVRVLAHFDRAAGRAAESIAPEPGGSVIVGMIPGRQVVRVLPDGAVVLAGGGIAWVGPAAQVPGRWAPDLPPAPAPGTTLLPGLVDAAAVGYAFGRYHG